MKKNAILLTSAVLALLFLILDHHVPQAVTSKYEYDITTAIIEDAKPKELTEARVIIEEHETLRIEETASQVKAYIRATCTGFTQSLSEEFGYQFPRILTFAKTKGKLTLTTLWSPNDGSEYEPSIRKNFPASIVKHAMKIDSYDEKKRQAVLKKVKAHFESKNPLYYFSPV